jgi:hypothetical protein
LNLHNRLFVKIFVSHRLLQQQKKVVFSFLFVFWGYDSDITIDLILIIPAFNDLTTIEVGVN